MVNGGEEVGISYNDTKQERIDDLLSRKAIAFQETVIKSENYINIMRVWLKVFSLKLNNETINYASLDSHLFSCFKEKVNSKYIFGEMFSIRSDWQKFPIELTGPHVNVFLHKEMNVNEDCTIMKWEPHCLTILTR